MSATAAPRSSPTTWWHLGYDRVVSSEWGTPNMVEAA